MLAFVGCNKTTVQNESQTPGEVTFKASCQSCHILPKTTMKSDDEWPQIVNRYGEKANLSVEQIKVITSYLTANN